MNEEREGDEGGGESRGKKIGAVNMEGARERAKERGRSQGVIAGGETRGK